MERRCLLANGKRSLSLDSQMEARYSHFALHIGCGRCNIWTGRYRNLLGTKMGVHS